MASHGMDATNRKDPSAKSIRVLPSFPPGVAIFLLFLPAWFPLLTTLDQSILPTSSEVKAKHDESLPLLALGSPADNGRRYRHSTETSTRMTALAVLITSGNGTVVAPDKNQRTFVALGTARVFESTLFPIPDLLTTSYGQCVF